LPSIQAALEKMQVDSEVVKGEIFDPRLVSYRPEMHASIQHQAPALESEPFS